MSILGISSTIDVIKDAVEGSSMAHGAMASNLVNVQTPNYHRVDVDFKEALAQASGDPASGDELMMVATHPNDFGATNPGEFNPVTSTDERSKMRKDGNNVDLDQEMAKLSMNADYGSMSAGLLKNQYAMLRQAIQV